MRSDLREEVKNYMNSEIKPNFAAIARQYDADYRTVKRAYLEVIEQKNENESTTIEKKKKASLLDPYRDVIVSKLELRCSAMAIYKFIQKRGFEGHYTIVRDFCRNVKTEHVNKATIRVEHTPGLSAQVDWKEEMTLYNRDGKPCHFNIFLYVLPYSKLKFLTLIFERSQDTLFQCLHEAFEHTGGVPDEIWFDNMKQVVDHTKSAFGHPVFNERFKQFSQDAGYNPIACRVYRPQTKGVVEALARTTERLRPYNYEFSDEVDLISLVDDLCEDLNYEVSQATDEVPIELWKYKEKEYLHQLPDNLLEPYFEENISRVVSKESMINFRKCKYSVDPRYIGKVVQIELTNDEKHIHIYYNGEPISSHELTTKKFNYHENDRIKILQSDLLKDKDITDIKTYISEHLSQYDEIGGANNG